LIRILLINPNASQATTAMMAAIAQSAAPDSVEIIGATAQRGVAMIVDSAALMAAAQEVVEIGIRHCQTVSGIIVSAFGDPGLAALRQEVRIPVVGIAEAAMLEAAGQSRRFGVATVTPGLVDTIGARAATLGLGHLYCGTRLTPGDPIALAADPDRLVEALAEAVLTCIQRDKAEAVVIGGGPLGDAATALAPRFQVPVIAPIPAAVRGLLARLQDPANETNPIP
jgi:allantoin racemase